MAPRNPENAPDVLKKAGQELMAGELRKKELTKEYTSEEKVPMYLSPMYRPYFGNVMRVSINGISIYFKVDGSTQLVPKTFADEIASRRMYVDAIVNKQRRMADIPNNAEKGVGELKLF